jgi:hypothetical protein
MKASHKHPGLLGLLGLLGCALALAHVGTARSGDETARHCLTVR